MNDQLSEASVIENQVDDIESPGIKDNAETFEQDPIENPNFLKAVFTMLNQDEEFVANPD